MSDVTVDEIEQLLEDERAALLLGDFAALAEIVARKEALVAELGEARLDRAGLARLKARAEHNAGLIAAAGKGLRAVTRRLGEIRRANGPLKTYGQDGSQQTLGSAAGTLEKRA